MKNKIEVRPATRADFVRYYGFPPPEQWSGLAATIDRLVVAIGGVCLWEDGNWWVFIDAAPVARSPAMFHRNALRFIRALDVSELRVLCDERFARAKEWLSRLGFNETEETYNGCKVWIKK